jgi:glycosyltransferase involved in cell wall biosynthesis
MSAYRFCFVTTFYPPYSFGGDAIGVQRLARALARRGHEVTVISDVNAFAALSRTAAPPLPPSRDGDGVTEVRLRSRLGLVAPALTQQSGRPLVHGRTFRRLLDQGGFDVVNYHNISLVGGPGILSYGGDAAKIYMAHEHWLVCPSHVLWRHNRERCVGRQCLRCVLHYHRPPQFWRYTGWLTRQLAHVDVFIAMSEFSREKHREFGFPRDMDVVPYFLPDGDPLRPSTADASPHERPFFLFVGRLERLKGLDDVIPAFRGFGAADLLIAGTGEHEPALRRLADGLPNVRFLGSVPNAALDRYYRHATALIVPSVGFETFGIVLIEAFRQGTPVIARRLGPFPEIIRAAQAGELFESTAELVEALKRLHADRAYRDRLAAAGREAFARQWTESAVVPVYLETVTKALRQRDVRLGRVTHDGPRTAHASSRAGRQA